jgi:hypothetical protein
LLLMDQAEHTKVMGALVNRGDPFVATVVKTKASSSGKPGFKAVILGAGGVLRGSMGGLAQSRQSLRRVIGTALNPSSLPNGLS